MKCACWILLALGAVTAQRAAGLGYEADNVRQDYTGYERDAESGLEFARARYYNPAHGRFTSADPLTASASIRDPQTFNRYSYALNSPYKFTDPLGLLAGDFYNENGEFLGTDGINDNKIYVVTDEGEAKDIKKTNKKKGTTQVSSVSSAIELPSLLVRRAVGAAVTRSNNPTADDAQGGFHEEGFIAGVTCSSKITADGKQESNRIGGDFCYEEEVHGGAEIVGVLRGAEASGKPVREYCREKGVHETTLYNWKKRFGTMDVDEVREYRTLIQENARLKRLLAERDLEIDAGGRGAKKKW